MLRGLQLDRLRPLAQEHDIAEVGQRGYDVLTGVTWRVLRIAGQTIPRVLPSPKWKAASAWGAKEVRSDGQGHSDARVSGRL